MTGEQSDNKKRAIPEPLAHAMTVDAFPEFARNSEYIAMVRIQLERMKSEVGIIALDQMIPVINGDDMGRPTAENINDALLLLDFLELGVQDRHAVDGMERIKQEWIKDGGQIREAISKTAVVGDIGGQ